ncbi:MAG: 6-pyruvoyl-tetrahydropterin synthase-related protein, partial [Anaerolineae bacterium]|nr:6-pyruvoyl-tetrahydropterin synthase-related protein [Anaerolineae bacterium]
MEGKRAWLNYAALALLCAVAVAPLLRGESPCSHDGALHYYRVVAMRHALSQGILFTRYLPDLAFGYGYPFFNYREPLSYYLTLLLYLVGLPLPVALNLVYVFSIVGSALGAYLLVRDLFGPRAGVVAAVAYAYAPYQFLDALLRANAPESVALPLFPLILWAFRRLALCGGRGWFLLSVATLVALYLNHNISSLLFTPFLMAYLLMLWLAYRRSGYWGAVVAALVLALGVTAFHLGPALLEQDYAQLHMSRVTRNNDFHYNFLSLAEIFALPTAVDTSLLNPPMRIHLGLAQVVLGGLGLVVGLARRGSSREHRLTLLFMAFSALAMLWMSTAASLWVWEHVPLLPFVQFPWRLVGRAVLPLVLLAGALFAQADSAKQGGLSRLPGAAGWLLALCVPIVTAFPYTYPPYGYCREAARPTITDVFAYERQSRLVGVDPEGSYFPVWVKRRPEGSPLEAQYAAGGVISRFDDTALPEGASLVEADYGPNRARIVIETPVPFRARYLVFYFPGWQVRIDGQRADVFPTDPEGLLSFDVPAGRHTISIRFASTPVRMACGMVSVVSVAGLVLVVLRLRRGAMPPQAGYGVQWQGMVPVSYTHLRAHE